MSSTKVAIEVAKSDINAWLDYKKITDKKRESYETNIETLTDAVVDGYLVYNKSDNTLDHKLKFSFGAEITVDSLTYSPRLNMQRLKPYLNGVKSTDADGRITAYICALTGKARGIIEQLDSEDLTIAQAVAIFFL